MTSPKKKGEGTHSADRPALELVEDDLTTPFIKKVFGPVDIHEARLQYKEMDEGSCRFHYTLKITPKSEVTEEMKMATRTEDLLKVAKEAKKKDEPEREISEEEIIYSEDEGMEAIRKEIRNHERRLAEAARKKRDFEAAKRVAKLAARPKTPEELEKKRLAKEQEKKAKEEAKEQEKKDKDAARRVSKLLAKAKKDEKDNDADDVSAKSMDWDDAMRTGKKVADYLSRKSGKAEIVVVVKRMEDMDKAGEELKKMKELMRQRDMETQEEREKREKEEKAAAKRVAKLAAKPKKPVEQAVDEPKKKMDKPKKEVDEVDKEKEAKEQEKKDKEAARRVSKLLAKAKKDEDKLKMDVEKPKEEEKDPHIPDGSHTEWKTEDNEENEILDEAIEKEMGKDPESKAVAKKTDKPKKEPVKSKEEAVDKPKKKADKPKEKVDKPKKKADKEEKSSPVKRKKSKKEIFEAEERQMEEALQRAFQRGAAQQKEAQEKQENSEKSENTAEEKKKKGKKSQKRSDKKK